MFFNNCIVGTLSSESGLRREKEDKMEDVLSRFVEALLQLIIVAVVPAAVALVVAWLNVKKKELEAKLPESVISTIQLVTDMVVKAAEQSGATDWLKEYGMEKKEWAMQQGEELLKEYLGLSLDLDKLGDAFWNAVLQGLDVSIEARVKEMNDTLWK